MGVDGDKPNDKLSLSYPGRADKKDGEVLDVSVSEVHKQAKIEQQGDHNRTVAQADTDGPALNNGRRRLSHRNPEDSHAAKKKKEKDRTIMRTALKQLLDRLNDMYLQIEAINQRLDEIDAEMSELESLKELAENGTLDPRNPAHAKLLKKYRITQEDIDSGSLLILLAGRLGQRADERTELEKRRDDLQEQANDAISEAQADGIITQEDVNRFRQHLQSSEAGVSAQVRITQEVSDGLKDIAVDHNSAIFRAKKSTAGLTLPDDDSSASSVAATLNGHGSYQKGVQSQGEEISIKEEFMLSARPLQDTLTVQEPALTHAFPVFKNT